MHLLRRTYPELVDAIHRADVATHRRILRVVLVASMSPARLDALDAARVLETFDTVATLPAELRDRLREKFDTADGRYLTANDGRGHDEPLSTPAQLDFFEARATHAILEAFRCADADGVCDVLYEALYARERPEELVVLVERALRDGGH